MLSTLLLTALLVAQPAPDDDAPIGGRSAPAGPELARPAGPRGPAPVQVFISPAGEPFRAPLGAPYPVAAWFAGADADKDGVLTEAEFTADALRFFATLDVDKDGWIDGFEVQDYETKVAPEILPRAPRGGPAGGAPRGAPREGADVKRSTGADGARAGRGKRPYAAGRSGAGIFGLINEVHPVMGQDADINRRIDLVEATRAAKDRFRILDEDKDGKLTLATLPRPPAQAMAEDRNDPPPP